MSSRVSPWWGKAWRRAVEEAAYAEEDLRRGRSLARAGAVGAVTVSEGQLVASVTDAAALVTVGVRVPVLDESGTAAFVEVVAAESGRVADLLAGRLPHTLVEHAEESGVELLPYGGELECTCTCQAWLDPCAHALAVLVQAGRLVEADPLVLVHLRGLPRERLVARLHELEPPSSGEDLELETAVEASLRAARVMELLGQPDAGGARVDHLF